MEALRVVLPYVILGGLWIGFSDKLLNLAPDLNGMLLISSIKGWAYVLITAVLLWVLVYSRINQLRISEAERQDSETRFRLLVESAPDAVFVQTDGYFAYVNFKTAELVGAADADALLGQPIEAFLPERRRAFVKAQILRAKSLKVSKSVYEETILCNGAEREVEVSAVPICFGDKNSTLVFMRDITERRRFEKNRLRMELQLRQKQRLESVGTLAGGIAHEINNPVSGVLGYAQLIAEHPAADETLREYSEEIIREASRIADTVKKLLHFSQPEMQAHSPASVRAIVDETVSLVHSALQYDQIELRLDIPDGLPDILCCYQQIEQVLMNLIANARDALNERYSGYDEKKVIAISAAAFDRDGQAWVRLTVYDGGTGIADDLLPRVFDPFYTSGTRSAHAGLGLSICHSIVKEHRGDIYFETQPGAFTRAIVELPTEGGALK
jgi:PAS domain S-box-containing protein